MNTLLRYIASIPGDHDNDIAVMLDYINDDIVDDIYYQRVNISEFLYMLAYGHKKGKITLADLNNYLGN